MAWTFERVSGPHAFSEGPVWDEEAVLFTDIPNSRILRYDPATGATSELRTGTNLANGLTVDRQGRLYACEGGPASLAGTQDPAGRTIDWEAGRRVVRYEAEGSTTVLADRFEGKRLNSPNDVVVDGRGRVWFTDPRYGDRSHMALEHDSVYRLDPRPDGTYAIARVTFDTTRPNGLVLSADERTLYVAESPPAPEGRRQLRAYPVRDDGSLGPYRVLHDFGPHRGIDGMRVDEPGNVVASCGWAKGGPGPRIGIFAPDGTVLADHPVPNNPTNCTFGDEDFQTLYVTDYTGSLYRARTDRRGLPYRR